MKIQLHPDGYIIVRDADGISLFQERRDLVEADVGEALSLPAGAVGMMYDADAGYLCYVDRGGSAHPVEGRAEHAFGDLVLASLAALQAAKLAREAPTSEQIAQKARRDALAAEAATDAFIDRLRVATPDEIKTYVVNNVTDLASARLFIGKLACATAYALSGGRDK